MSRDDRVVVVGDRVSYPGDMPEELARAVFGDEVVDLIDEAAGRHWPVSHYEVRREKRVLKPFEQIFRSRPNYCRGSGDFRMY